ncbi:MAG: metallophosphoesterase [Gammaproteobacteria bacterium]|nr:metallophosphoesterase [Gammaproteobacteria bacterium]
MNSLQTSAENKLQSSNNLLGACFLLLQIFLSQSLFAVEDQWQDVERVVAIGDIHGDYDNFLKILEEANVVNRRGNWIAGKTHLVQLGDVPDRGPDTDKAIALLQKLERQAEREGGKVHVLIGNHEAMNIYGDLRYVDPGEYAAFRTRNSRRIRDDFYKRDIEKRKLVDSGFFADGEFRQQWEQSIPLGMLEHRSAWGREGDIGAWVRQHNTVIKINRTLFLHGGISPEDVGMSITEINEQIRLELNGGLGEDLGLSERATGPLWYRGLATSNEEMERLHLELVLATYDVDRVVIGHTPSLGTIVPRFEGRVLVIDTGLSSYYGGFLASLLLENGEATTLQRNQEIPVPNTKAGLLPYFERIAELEPRANALQVRIRNLASPPL